MYNACTLCMHMSWKSSTLCCLRCTNYSYSVWVPLFFCFFPSAMLATLNSRCPLHYPTKQGLLYTFIRFHHHDRITVVKFCFLLKLFSFEKSFFLSLSLPFFHPSFLHPSLHTPCLFLFSFFFLNTADWLRTTHVLGKTQSLNF